MKHSFYLSWGDIECLVNDLETKIRKSGQTFSLIAGVTRGGLVPAVMLSHRLKIPMVSIASNEMIEHDHETLIIDEIYDTGKTIFKLKELNPRAKFAVLYHNEMIPELDFYCIKQNLNEWIVFPWENGDDR